MAVDYTPDFQPYKNAGKFRYWCQTTIPLVYDDSKSYLELLYSVISYLNSTIEDVAAMGKNVDALLEAYTQLQTYVNNYFDNLDVQEEINKKLDDMAASGDLDNLLEPFVQTFVGAWLEEHLTPTTPPVDNTLTIEGAAADAKATGDAIKAVTNGRTVGHIILNGGAALTIDTTAGTLDLTVPSGSFCKLYYGQNKSLRLRENLHAEFTATQLPDLWFDLTAGNFVLKGAGYADYPTPSENYIYLGDIFHNINNDALSHYNLYVYPQYTVNGKVYHTKNLNWSDLNTRISAAENGRTEGMITVILGAEFSVDYANNTISLSAPSGTFAKLFYGANKGYRITGDVSATINFANFPLIYYDLVDHTFIGVAGGGETIPDPERYVYIGFVFGAYRYHFNVYPYYTFNGAQIITKDQSYDCYNGRLQTYNGGILSVDTVAGTVSIEAPSGSFVKLWYGHNKSIRIREDKTVSITASALPNIYYDIQGDNLVALPAGNDVTEENRDRYIYLGFVWNSDCNFNCYPYYKVNGRVIPNNTASGVLPRQMRMAVVGDSISTFRGVSPNVNGGGHYPTGDITTKEECYEYIAASQINASIVRLQAVSQSTIKYQQIGGEDAYGWAPAWITAVQAVNPDIIIINLGTNDVFSTITGEIHPVNQYASADQTTLTADTYGCMQWMIMSYQHACPNARIIVCCPSAALYPESAGDTSQDKFNAVCDLILACAEQYGCEVVDFRKCGINFENIATYKADNIHPNKTGMAMMGNYLGYRLSEIIY